MPLVALPITPINQQDASGSTEVMTFDGGDPVYGGVTGGVVMAAATEAELARFILGGRVERVHLNVANTGPTNAFTAMRIQSQAHPNANFEDLITSAVLNTGTGVVDQFIGVSANPTTLAAAADANIVFFANSAYAVRVLATSTSGTKGTARMTAKVP